MKTRTRSRLLPLAIQGAAAGRALSRGAAVAMVAHSDRAIRELPGEEIAKPPALAAERQAQHLVEVAVVDVALPVNRDQAAAHHRLEVLLAVRAMQQVHVAVELPLRDQHRAETLDRHVGERID